ncbi:papilin-like [Perca fluviatilis]|uniref:papilin-like n=1 Tax=Perca fluviatilis TaxID=8168 RepID=UPI001963B97F|nr:papilin-like [Perca fluviatilis]
MFGSGLVGFCLLVLALGFLGRPGLAHNGKMHSESLQETVVPEPAQCLVSRIYNLIRPAESKDDRSCWQDCFAKTDCHMAVVTKRISAAQQCLLVNCLNHGNHSLPRDPSAEITVYPKSTIDDELRANLMKRAHGAVDERLRCYERGCQSESPRFFYNTTSSRCERLFGGCGSNMKTFKTLKSCATLCHKKVRCYLPVEYGQTPPVGHLPFGPDNVSSTNADTTGKPKDTTVNFYFYNVSSGSCEGFHFRGSASNGNIFRTVQECESLCGDVKGNKSFNNKV